MQYSEAIRNARLDVVETTIGASAVLRIRTGAAPATCADADTGTVLVEIDLPADYMAAAAGGAKALAGAWADVGVAAGAAAHFRIYDTAGTTCHIQGTVTATGGGGDMTLQNTSIAVDQPITVATFGLTAGNA